MAAVLRKRFSQGGALVNESNITDSLYKLLESIAADLAAIKTAFDAHAHGSGTTTPDQTLTIGTTKET